jgi:hypothetical protein
MHLKPRCALGAGSWNCHFLTDSRVEPGHDRVLVCGEKPSLESGGAPLEEGRWERVHQ